MSELTAADWKLRSAAISLPQHALIGGRKVPAQSGASFECRFPGTGRVIAKVTACSSLDVDLAVRSARRAFETTSWASSPAARRKALLRLAELVAANHEELALLETLNVGKPIQSSLTGDVPAVAGCLNWYAEAIDKVYGEVATTESDFTALMIREPVGVVGAIVPWNYPLLMAAWKLGPALAAGNAVVLKPAEQSPFTALRLGELALEAGVPPGILNVVPGLGAEAGRAVGLHMDVDCIGFTGSTEVGRLFLQYAGTSNIKQVRLELGGKSPQVVLGDCTDLEAAARGICAGIFDNAGQICNAGSRLVVDEAVKEELLGRILQQARALVPADPLDPGSRLGAIVTEQQMDRVLSYVQRGQQEGASLLVGGSRVLTETGGYFVEPTVFDGVRNTMRIAREEIFGPVLSVITVSGVEQAVAVANDTFYGLAAGIWTDNVKTAFRVAKAVRAGVVWVNCFDVGRMSVAFGGVRQSGFGRDKSLHALDEYSYVKSVWLAH